MQALTKFITAKKTSWIVLVVAFLAVVAVFALGSGSSDETAPGVGLPESAESAQVSALQEELPSADQTSALFVYSRDGDELTDEDLEAINDTIPALAEESAEGFVPPATVSDDGTTAIVAVPLEAEADVTAQAERAAEL